MIKKENMRQITYISRAIIIIYFILLALFGASFAKLQILPFAYVTDIFLFILSLLAGYIMVQKKAITVPPFTIYLLLILFWAFFELIRGLILYHELLYALRQFAPFLYILFIPMLAYFYDDLRQILVFFYIFFGISVFNALLWIINIHLNWFPWGLALLLFPYLFYSNKNVIFRVFTSVGAIILLFAAFSTTVRGLWISLSLSLLFIGILSYATIKDKNIIKHIAIATITFVLILIITLFSNANLAPRIISTIQLNKIDLIIPDKEKFINSNKTTTDYTLVEKYKSKGFSPDEAEYLASSKVPEEEINQMMEKLANNYFPIEEVHLVTIEACKIKQYNERHDFINKNIQTKTNDIVNNSSEGTFSHKLDIANSNIKWRLVIWKDMILEWSKQPFIGYGFGNHFYSTSLKNSNWVGALTSIDPHNSHIHILYMLGGIGYILFIAFFIAVFRDYIIKTKHETNITKQAFYISMLGGMLFILILANFEVVLESPYMVIFLWLWMGLLLQTGNNKQEI